MRPWPCTDVAVHSEFEGISGGGSGRGICLDRVFAFF